ncbi:MAG TPA: acyl-CoA dehydratase activase, partial [Bacteroidales bacterium]|nr:acyl-CoA dehydratase activase [Bacteroidales bacterium]
MNTILSGNLQRIKPVLLGFDIGSISLNTVVLDDDFEVIENYYEYCRGKPFQVLLNRLSDILSRHALNSILHVGLTGTGGKLAAELTGGVYINEIIASSRATGTLFPQAKTIIEIGGEDSKLIIMERAKYNAHSSLSDFSMNSICAAGTGSFLDQQAKRIGVSIENDFGQLALKSENPPRIAGRCSVFAKSDMIHLQQIATPVQDIVAGLCFAVARNFKSNLGRGRDFHLPIIFQGGVAANAGVVRAFSEILHLKPGELIVPEYYASMGAIGSVIQSFHKGKDTSTFRGPEQLIKYLEHQGTNDNGLPRLKKSCRKLIKSEHRRLEATEEKIPVYLGVDVGSLSTNLVLIDDNNQVIARRYLPTASRPLEAIQQGLSEIYEETGNRVDVMACGTTGSGRYLTGDFIGADTIQNEITAQATAAISIDKTVDTIFEIGGQDSKFISIDNGVVVDFEMNKVCAAGTGSFLEEQAEKLGINIIEEFEGLALHAEKPADLGNRCTVFIESALNAHQQSGEENKNLVGGLAYSIVYNYLQKVVGDKRVGDHIFFQGGVANNAGVVAAFEQVTGKKIIVPPDFDVTGAIGMAMLARKTVENNNCKTAFKGFEVRNKSFLLDKFTCKGCSNHCEIRKVKIEDEKTPLYYGGRCEKYEVAGRKGRRNGIINLFDERYQLLLRDYNETINKEGLSIGIPRELMLFYQEFPFWQTFFRELGFRVILSGPSDRNLVSNALEIMPAETCFPVEVMSGHVHDLLQKGVDYIFIPFIVNVRSEEDNSTSNCNCPWIQSYPLMIRSARNMGIPEDKLLIPVLHPRYFRNAFLPEITRFMAEKFKMKREAVKKALDRAGAAQQQFLDSILSRGCYILNNLPSEKKAVVILGRPYNTGDPELNLRLVEKLLNLDVIPIPLDFLPLEDEPVFRDYRNMYWPNGRKILAAAQFIAKHDKLHAVYISYFRCGPDSFLSHFVREELKGKPYLQIE